MRTLLRLGLALLVGALALGGSNGAAAKSEARSPISALAVGDDQVWAWANTYHLLRVDSRRVRITARIDTTPALITQLAIGEGALWGSGFCGRPRCRSGTLVRSTSAPANAPAR